MIRLMKNGKVIAEYKIGDIVRLNSGGPRMTIVGFTDHGMLSERLDKAICHWIVMSPEPAIGAHTFDLRTLTKDPRDQVL